MVVSARPRRPYRWRHNWIPRNPAAALIKAKGNERLAERYMARHGAGGGSTSTKAKPRADEGPYFRKTGPELRDLAGRGDRQAQAEIDRRASRKAAAGGKVGGKREGVPFRPGDRPTTPRPRTEPAPTVPGLPHSKRRGGPISNVPKTPASPFPPGPPTDTLDAAQRVSHAQGTFGFGSPEHVAALNEQNKLWTAGESFTIESRKLDGTSVIMHAQRNASGERIGSVVQREGRNTYDAKYQGKPLGEFSSRFQAHKELDRADRAAADTARRKAATATRKSAGVARGAGGPVTWEPYAFTADDGTFSGRLAAAKIKQSFRSGNKTILIEPDMTRAQTQAFLADVGSILEKANLPEDLDITFKVPTGDRHFRTSARGGTTGAYVIRGGRTVYVNPGIANGRLSEGFAAGGHSGHFMPAARGVTGTQYTLTHELGHVVDGANGHTFASGGATPSGLPLPDRLPEDVNAHKRGLDDHLSRYGRTNVAEAYAEAFAQWVHGGPGSSVAADSYARRYGWPTPKIV